MNLKYWYSAKVTKVYDGDTVTLDVDLGMNTIKRNVKIRLADINAPELRGKERQAGIKSRDFLRDMIMGKDVLINTRKDKKGKYGRWIGDVYINHENISDILIKEGLAERKEY